MTTIETIKSNINETLDHAKMKVDALSLQARLEKAELIKTIQHKKKAMAHAASDVGNYLENIGSSVGDVKAKIKAEAESLRLQVTLGEMEGKSASEQAKDELTQYASRFESALSKAKAVEAEKVDKVKEKFTAYMTKMSDLKASLEAKVESYKF